MKIWNWKDSNKEPWLNPSSDMPYIAERWSSLSAHNVIDLGCGFGYNTAYLASKGFNVTAIDVANYAVKHTTKVLNEYEVKANVIDGDFCEMPFEDGIFDCVLANNLIFNQSTEEFMKILSSITRTLKTGGELFITLVSKETYDYVNKSKDSEVIDKYTILAPDSIADEKRMQFYVDIKDIVELFPDYTFVTAPIENNVYDMADTKYFTKRFSLLLKKK